MIRFQSWNVNGIRAVRKKEDWAWFEDRSGADIIGIQETKAHEEQISEGSGVYAFNAFERGN